MRDGRSAGRQVGTSVLRRSAAPPLRRSDHPTIRPSDHPTLRLRPLNSAPHLLARQALAALRTHVERAGFAGYDPYDALNSPVVRLLTFGTATGRIFWTQVFRRSPVNLRPLVGVPRKLNAKGLGLFLESYSRLWQLDGDEAVADRITWLLGQLEAMVSPGYAGACWGYPFDWQSRAAFVPAGTPTIVNTAFIGHALLDCHERVGLDRARDLACRIPEFFLKHLNRLEEGDQVCFSYTPLDRNFVHNANMLAASLLMRLAKSAGEKSWAEAAHRSMGYSVSHQRPDGSWSYAETSIQQWIDSFHTGFNLEALRWFLRLGEATDRWREAYRSGVRFYAGQFFLPDGTPKYYHNRVYPIDVHAPAEGVCFFSGEGPEHAGLTDRILSWMLAHLWDEGRGCFHFRRGRWVTNRISYMRWSQAWGMRALSAYCHAHGHPTGPERRQESPRKARRDTGNGDEASG